MYSFHMNIDWLITRVVNFILAVMVGIAVGTTALGVAPHAASAEVRSDKGDQTVVIVKPNQLRKANDNLLANFESLYENFTEDLSPAGSAAVTQVLNEVDSGQLAVHLPKDTTIAESQAKVLLSGKTGERLVFVPYTGSVVEPSGLTVQFNVDNYITETLEGVYQTKNETSGTVAIWRNGELIKNVLIDASSKTLTAFSWFGHFEYCLTDIMAVPGWIIAGIGIACGAICWGSAGIACPVCLAGMGGAFEGAVGYCIGYATKMNER